MKTGLAETTLFGIDDIADAVTQLANRKGFAPENLITDLEDKVLGSQTRPAQRDVSPSRTFVEVPNIEDTDHAVMVIRACRIGSYLTVGNEEIRVPFSHQDNTVQTAVDRLFDSDPDSFTAITIGQLTYTIDPSLKYEVYNALMNYLAKI